MKRKIRKILIRIPIAPSKRAHKDKSKYNRKPKHKRKHDA